MARMPASLSSARGLSSRAIRPDCRRCASTSAPPHQPLLDQDKYGRVRMGLGLPQTRVLSLDEAKRIDQTAYAVEHQLIPFWSCRYLIDFLEVLQSAQAHGRRAATRVRTRLNFDVAAVPRGHWCSGYVAPRNQEMLALFSSQSSVGFFAHVEDAYMPSEWQASQVPRFSVPYPKLSLGETNRLLLPLSAVDTFKDEKIMRFWEARDKARPFVCPVYMPMIKVSTASGHLVLEGASSTAPARKPVPNKLGMELPAIMSMLLVDPAWDEVKDPTVPLTVYAVPAGARELLGEIIAETTSRDEFTPSDWVDPDIYPLDPMSKTEAVDLNNMSPMSHNFGTTELLMDRVLRGHELAWPSFLPVKVPEIDADLQARRLARVQAAAAAPSPLKTSPPPRAASRPSATQQRSADFERRQKLARERQEHERKRAAEHLGRLAGSSTGSAALRPAPGRLPLGAIPDPQGYYTKCGVNTNPKFLMREHQAAVDRHIHMRWREQFTKHHPDRGGDPQIAAAINEAFEQIKTFDVRLKYSIASGYVPTYDPPAAAKPTDTSLDPKGYYSACGIAPDALFFKAEHEVSVNAKIKAQWHALSQKYRGNAVQLQHLNSAYANIKNLIARLHYRKEPGIRA